MENIERLRILLEEFGIEYHEEIDLEDYEEILSKGKFKGNYNNVGRLIYIMSDNSGVESNGSIMGIGWVFDKTGKFKKLKMEM